MPIPKESSHETIDDLYSCREFLHGEKGVLRYQMMTPYHAKYFAYELTKRCPSDSMEKFASALVDARVDLNPHQIEAALFAFRSPLSKGALLADEVGLGKTIEASLVLSQKWAERKRRILVITPANLRKQWHQELHPEGGRRLPHLHRDHRSRGTIARRSPSPTFLATRKGHATSNLLP